MSDSFTEAAKVILDNQGTGKTKEYDITAQVTRVEKDTIWVHIDGGVDETPCLRTVECSPGEYVRVRIANGTAWVMGNSTSPSTDDTTANVAIGKSVQAAKAADEAQTMANSAEAASARALVAADSAEDSASSAASSASSAASSAAAGAVGEEAVFKVDADVGDFSF